jgi:hypothetical protein
MHWPTQACYRLGPESSSFPACVLAVCCVKAVPFWEILKWEPQHPSCSDLCASCVAPTCTMSQVFYSTWILERSHAHAYSGYDLCSLSISSCKFFFVFCRLVTWITTGLCLRHLVYAFKLTNCLFLCMGTGEATPSSLPLLG